MDRNQLIDIAKGVGILLVVFGHNPLVLQSKGELYNIIFSFHVPLFFFLSGIYFNPEKSLKVTLIEKADSLLKPYFITLLLLGIAYFFLYGENLIYYTAKMLYGNGSTITWMPLWFLTHLFAVILFSWMVTNLVFKRLNTTLSKVLLLSVMFIFGIATVADFRYIDIDFFNKTFTLPGLPFSMDLIPITAFYFLLGHLSAKYILTFKPLLSIVVISILLFSGCHYFFDQTIDLNLRMVNGFIVPIVQSLCGIYLVLTLSFYLQSTPMTGRLFSLFGVSSLFILIFHFSIQYKAVAFASYIFGEKNMFSMTLAFIIGSLIPVLIWYIVKKNDYLSLFFMPVKSNKMFQGLH